MLTSLIELTFSDAHTVDCDAGVIRGVRVLGRQSRNGREYSDRALAEAAALYQGIGVNLNHPDRRETNRERPVEAGFGWLEAVEVKDDGVYADLHYLRSHPQAGLIVEAAQRNPKRLSLLPNSRLSPVDEHLPTHETESCDLPGFRGSGERRVARPRRDSPPFAKRNQRESRR
jgi:hypothetical protein